MVSYTWDVIAWCFDTCRQMPIVALIQQTVLAFIFGLLEIIRSTL
jgi:hypothetical protein